MEIKNIIPKNVKNKAIDEIMLIEPKNITFGRRDYDAIQENVITCLSDAVQNHVSNKMPLQTDLFNQPSITILADEAGGEKNKNYVIDSIRELYKRPFKMRWVHPETHQTRDSEGPLITMMHDVKGTNKIELTLNLWAIPFLLYYGKGVGGTRFNKYLALKIKGKYSKRIYKILSANKDRADFYYDIDQFKEDLAVPSSYTNTHIRKEILERSRDELKEIGADVMFDYEMITKRPVKGRKPKADTILFKIITPHPREVGGEQYNMYSFIYNEIFNTLNVTTNLPVRYADKLVELGLLKQTYERFGYWYDQRVDGSLTREHYNNKIKKYIKEETGIKE